ncbi:class F sortase [Ornithinimicrobium cerasi]|uniref:class F sortase n=1 Tax=Ornithinimicrobium cerasi TaxID=2248773 RepID=UPI000F008D62|nr:class F sortase [Ornithinimicrobium cerasi]
MAPRTAPRRPRQVSVVAIAVTLLCLVLAGWAVRGLLQDPVPQTADFGSSTVDLDVAGPASEEEEAPSPVAESSTATSSPPSGPTPAPAAGSTTPGPGRSSAALPPAQEQAAPVRLSVPSLDLVVEIDGVGVASDGQMEIPEEPDRAGWYRYGPAPGSDAGSVVVAGHVDTTTGPGAFLDLTRVEEGAEVVVELDDGTSTTYRVVGGEQVAKSDLAVDEIFRRDGDPVLRMVTCSGDWSPRTGSYTDNLVISAVPEQ